MTASDFQLHRGNRDAWYSIRGYVYQIDTTVLRWMHLGSDDCLELERGEDIDQVFSGIKLGPQEGRRIIEQIKVSQRNITLKTPAVLEFLANSYLHDRANLELNLTFQFTTTAQIGSERPLILPNGDPALEFWRDLQETTLDANKELENVRAIGEFLKGARRPEGIPDADWIAFRKFLETADLAKLRQFLLLIYWSCGAPDVNTIKAQICEALQKYGYASSEKFAYDQYSKLFVTVVQTITKPGIKRLDREGFDTCIRNASLIDEDRILLNSIGLRIEEHDRELEGFQERLMIVESQLVERAGVPARLPLVTGHPMLDAPLTVTNIARRSVFVNELKSAMTGAHWLSIYGNSGIGKSQLLKLLLEAIGSSAPWIRMSSSKEISDACTILDSALAHIGATGEIGYMAGLYQIAVPKIGTNPILVIDDLPKCSGRDELFDRLALLAAVLGEHGGCLITNGYHRLRTLAASRFPEARFLEVASRCLSELDIAEILVSMDVPQPGKLALTQVIFAKSGGHPQVVAAICRFLAARDWDLQAIPEVFTGEYQNEIEEDTIGSIVRTVVNPDAQELLYRESLCAGQFDKALVRKLARVEPQIDRQVEHHLSLVDIWLSREAPGQFRVSPLVVEVGASALDPNVVKRCKGAIARWMLKQDSVSISDATLIIGYLCSAEEHANAASVLIRIYLEMGQADDLSGDLLPLAIWPPGTLPAVIPIGSRIVIRGLQVGLLGKSGRSPHDHFAELLRLLDDATTSDSWAAGLVAVAVGGQIANSSPLIAAKLAGIALQRNVELSMPPGVEAGIWANPFTNILWMAANALRDGSDVHEWLDIVFELSPEQQSALTVQREIFWPPS